MKIEKVKGSHSERDKIILLTAKKEAITLEDVFKIVEVFTKNELRRIRIDSVRNEIINSKRPFMFEDELIKRIKKIKEKELI